MKIEEYKYKLCIPCSILNHYDLCPNDDTILQKSGYRLFKLKVKTYLK